MEKWKNGHGWILPSNPPFSTCHRFRFRRRKGGQSLLFFLHFFKIYSLEISENLVFFLLDCIVCSLVNLKYYKLYLLAFLCMIFVWFYILSCGDLILFSGDLIFLIVYVFLISANCGWQQLFMEAIQNGTMEGFYRLISYFQTQSEPAYCGLASLSMVLNALAIDPGRKWKGSFYLWFGV